MDVNEHTERVVQLLMRGDPLESRKLRISEARVLAELVKRHVDGDKIPYTPLESHEKGRNGLTQPCGVRDMSMRWLPATSVFPNAGETARDTCQRAGLAYELLHCGGFDFDGDP